MKMKFKDAMNFVEKRGCDIGDETWDFGTYFEFDSSSKDDGYDFVMNYIAENLTINKYREDWYSPCEISEFIMNNKKFFDAFMKECNNEDYQPQECGKDDEEFFDIYLSTFEGLVSGNYSDDDYFYLTKLIKEGK